EENGEVEEGLLEEKADRAVVHDLDTLRPPLEHVGLGTPVILIAEFDILRSDGLAVLELDTLPQGERGALRICGNREVLRQSGMVVELGALSLEEGVVDRGKEIVRSRRAVVLLGVQPAGCEAGMPREDDLALGRGPGRRGEGDGCRHRCSQNQGESQDIEATTSWYRTGVIRGHFALLPRRSRRKGPWR